MLISEIYSSRQGEGLLTGTPSIFIRTSGCNLRCRFCDTPYTSWTPEGEQKSVEEIVQEALQIQSREAGLDHVVITGGEPMLPGAIVKLTKALSSLKFHLTIETAGTLFRPVTCDLISVSPKFSNSDPDTERAGQWAEKHRKTRQRADIVQKLICSYEYQLKFVVDLPSDIDEILDYLRLFPQIDPSRVLLMPQGIDPAELQKKHSWLGELCQQHGFILCERKHIQWYGNRRGT